MSVTGLRADPRRHILLPWLLAAAALLALAFLRWGMPSGHRLHWSGFKLDLSVYRVGSRAWLQGRHLYGRLPATSASSHLPFTYPPFAAVALAPLAVLPFGVSSVVITAASIVLLGLTMARVMRRPLHPALFVAVTAMALMLEPVRSTLSFGQVNVVLMAMIAVDCLATTTRWPRGVLVGIAAGIKLTPLAFIVFFLVNRDRSAARNAVLGFVGTALVGLAANPSDSRSYWTHIVWRTNRIGSLDYAGNQSIKSALDRFGLHGGALMTAWFVLALLTIVVAAWATRAALSDGEPELALCLVGIMTLLVSPIAWTHHWVWLAPLVVTLAAAGPRQHRWVPLALAAIGLLVAYTGPPWRVPFGHNRELAWNWWQQLVGSTYVIYGVVVLAAVAVPASRWQPRATRLRGMADRVGTSRPGPDRPVPGESPRSAGSSPTTA